jgi:hypothetical protein
VIDEDTVAHFETATSGTGFDDKASGLVSGDDTAIALRTFAQVLAVDGANVGAADGGRFDSKQDFTVSGCGYRDGAHFNGAVAGQIGGVHGAGHDSISAS